MIFLFGVIFVFTSAETELADGKTVSVDSNALFGTEENYKFFVGSVNSSDLVISLTSYSDFSDPDMFVKAGKKPSYDDYEFKSLSWGSGSIIITPSELKNNTDYHILVVCYTICGFGITVSYSKEISLEDGVPIAGQLTKGRQGLYQFNTGNSSGDSMSISVSSIKGKVDMYVVMGYDTDLTADNSLSIDKTWEGNLVFNSKKFTANTTFRTGIMAEKNSTYTILAKANSIQATKLQAGVPISGEVSNNTFNYYYFTVLSENETISISLTMLTGNSYIFVKAGELPTLTNYDFSSSRIGNENLIISYIDRKNIGHLTGKYYLGVYGYSHSVYTLTVTTSNSTFIELTPGIPQSGSVNQSNVVYFYLKYPQVDANVTIGLTVSSGNADLYAKKCSKELKKCQFENKELVNPDEIYSSMHVTGSESIEIPHKAETCSKSNTCNYVIGVYGVLAYSTFTITVTTNNSDEIILQDGKPTTITVENGVSKHFKFTVFNESVSEVIIMITPVYGDADLFGNLNEIPTNGEYEKESLESGIEIDQIKWVKGVDTDSLKGTYHLMTYALKASSFSIVAKTVIPGKKSTIQIYPGHPQKDTVYNYTDQDYRIYMFPVHYTDETKQKLTITLTAITGKFGLYVANELSNLDWKNEIFYYNWKASDKEHKDHYYKITIKTNDPEYLLDSTYLILVMADKFSADKSATFVINYAVGDGSIILSEDTPYTGVVLSSEYEYFTFPIHYLHEDISISLTSLSGDADLYLSMRPNNTFPTEKNYQFKSATYKNEKITLNWEEGLAKACPGLPETYKFGNKTQCYLYIGVFGFQTSTYTIRIHPRHELPIILTVGEPFFAVLNESEYGYYYSYVQANEAVKISVQADLGDPDLFVNIIDKANAPSSIAEWQRPNSEVFDLQSRSTVLTEDIRIESSDLKAKCSSGVCLIISAVLCMEENCSYFIQVSQQNGTQTLIENQPTYGTSNQDFVYFHYYSNRDFDNFLIQVTPINSGNPDLYICKGKDIYPQENLYDWTSTSWGGDSILITKDDKKFNGGSMKGSYTIGVIDLWGASSFTILVNNNPSPILKLQSGIPQYGNINNNTINYYYYENNMQEDIIISLTPTSGTGSIFVNTFNQWDGDMYSHLPGPDSFLWSSNTSSNKYTINITASDKNFCSYCDYIIAIKPENSLTYTLTAKSDLQVTLIQDGIPVRSKTSPKHWSVFSFEILTSTDFYVTLSCYSGTPNLYISKSKELNWGNFVWTSYYVQGTMNLKVEKNHTEFKVGTYYVVVESNGGDAYFSLVMHTADNFITLIDGWPVVYSLPPSKTEGAYMRLMMNGKDRYSFTLKAFASYCPIVYIKIQSPKDPLKKPSPTYCDYFDLSDYCRLTNTYNGDKISYLSISDIVPANTSNILFSIYNNDSKVELEFELEASVSTEILVMPLNEYSYSVIYENEKKRYEFITIEKGQLDIYLIPCEGSFKMEISSNWTLVTQEMPDIVVNRLTEGTLAGSIHNANGIYYATISKIKDSSDIASFLLLSVFTKQGDVRKTPYRAGNNGLINWKILNKNHIEVTWTGLEDDYGNQINETIEYEVYYTSSNESLILTSCSIQSNLYSQGELKYLDATINETRIEVEIPDSKGYINIIAYLGQDSNSALHEIIYDPTEVLVNGRNQSKNVKFLFILLVIILFLAIGTSYYYYKKKKQAENILNFEMNDVRNVASVPPNPDAQKRPEPYSQF